MEEKKDLLTITQEEAMRGGSNIWVRALKAELTILTDRESQMCNQRSRVLWLSKVDNNSKYFHSKATKRFRKNAIFKIKDSISGDRWQTHPEDIGRVISEYYKEIFTTSQPALPYVTLSYIPHVVIDEINEQLTGEFMEWEVLVALK